MHMTYAPAPGVVVAPVPGFFPGAGEAYYTDWSSGLFGCFDDCDTCCLILTSWCPCVTFGRTAEIVDQGTSGMLFSLIPEAPPCADFVVHRSCLLCYEPVLGWEFNAQRATAAMSPPTMQGMGMGMGMMSR